MKLMRFFVTCGVAAIGLLMATAGLAQERSEESIGQRVDQAIGELRQEARDLAGQVRETFAQMRAKVEQMSVAARVYARIRWDKALSQTSISVDVDKGVATLTGTVPNEAAKTKAGTLAGDTVGVEKVTNQLQVTTTTSAR